MKKTKNSSTSWEKAGDWYNKAVGEKGHYYHEKVIFPNFLRLMQSEGKGPISCLDLACGQGVLSRRLPDSSSYVGIDLSPALLSAAKEQNRNPNHLFLQGDITKPLPITRSDFSFCTVMLALQNVKDPLKVFQNAKKHLAPQGKLLFVINHPCFRIPKFSFWGIDEEADIQYRRVDRYASSLTIPIAIHPGQGKKSVVTPSFHHPLSSWFRWLYEAGFFVEVFEEWHSDKKSTGRCAPREDLSRQEIPLFLAIRACLR